MRALDLLLDGLPPWALVGGKGGVGKTTCAAALAARSAERGETTLLISTDPAGSLGGAMGVELTQRPRAVPGRPGLGAMQLDAAAAREAFLQRHRGTLALILDRGTYLDAEDVDGLIDTALPGADEIFALLALGELAGGDAGRVVIDTAPTGHTLRLLALPRTFAAVVELLETMQAKHRFMVSALTRRYRADEADAFIARLRGEIEALRLRLADPERTGMVLVTRPETIVVAETVRYAAELGTLGIHVGALVVNAVAEETASPRPRGAKAPRRRSPPPRGRRILAGSGGVLSPLESIAVPTFVVPLLETPPIGLAGARAWGGAMQRSDTPAAPVAPAGKGGKRARAGSGRVAAATGAAGILCSGPVPVRSLTIVGGKGGVGKTTVACALAIAAAAGSRVLLVSTDPAPSIADALDQPIGDEETPVAGVDGLLARQMDAAAAFERLRAAYRDRVDELFDRLIGRGLDAAHDRAVVRDLLALAPPGIDELYALSSLGETLVEARFEIVVVDPAPTGHLLRLLDMPALALEWTHRLMRIMLKYRDVVGLGETAAELLAFARRTRIVRDLLADRERAGLVLVALDEPLVRLETSRLVSALAERGVALLALVWNRVPEAPSPLSLPPDVPQVVCAAVHPSPVGVDAVRRWRETWRLLPEAHG